MVHLNMLQVMWLVLNNHSALFPSVVVILPKFVFFKWANPGLILVLFSVFTKKNH